MSLRFRLVVLVVVALLTSVMLGGAATLMNASRSVHTEMLSALQVGRQTINDALRGIDVSPDPQRDLDDLVASFKGSRHLRVSVTGATAAEEQPVKDRSPFGGAPHWFARLVAVAPETDRIPIIIDGRMEGTVVIETDPRNEIREVWNELSSSLVVLALFGGATIPAIYLLLGRALRPLGRLTDAMEQVGRGDYDIRINDQLPPELARLRDSFNHMAGRLAAADNDNRRLNEQLLTLQEEERGELARDLHDEIGPFLFAINVDIANMSRLLAGGRAEELPAHIQSIAEAARHIQRHVREMLGRLRPIGLAELGLATAIDDLVDFWRRRCPAIEFRVDIAQDGQALGERLETTIYRVVQECLSNAIRHAEPGLIAVAVARDPLRNHVSVEVRDDGTGPRRESERGYGLIGMEERINALGGRLSLTRRAGRGFAVHASLPCAEAIRETAT
jgi:two-component system sensor histidine kinase UhpB